MTQRNKTFSISINTSTKSKQPIRSSQIPHRFMKKKCRKGSKILTETQYKIACLFCSVFHPKPAANRANFELDKNRGDLLWARSKEIEAK